MQFPKEYLKSVIFIGYTNEKGERYVTGTGFIIAKPSEDGIFEFRYLVTAFHNISRAHEKGLESLELRLNVKNDGAIYVNFPLDQFVFHPDHAEGLECVDVAVAPIVLDSNVVDFLQFDISTFADEQIMSSEHIGLGDEIAIVGLFTNHVGKTRNEPIVRIGNICAMPVDKVKTKIGNMQAYLIEARSIGGLSGSPVFVYMSYVRANMTKINTSTVKFNWNIRGGGVPMFYCIGLVHGHYDTDVAMDAVINDASGSVKNVNIGVAVVVPAVKILETLNQPKLMDLEQENLEVLRKRFE